MKTATPVPSKQETACLGRHKHLNKVDGLVSCPKDLLPRKDSENLHVLSSATSSVWDLGKPYTLHFLKSVFTNMIFCNRCLPPTHLKIKTNVSQISRANPRHTEFTWQFEKADINLLCSSLPVCAKESIAYYYKIFWFFTIIALQ